MLIAVSLYVKANRGTSHIPLTLVVNDTREIQLLLNQIPKIQLPTLKNESVTNQLNLYVKPQPN